MAAYGRPVGQLGRIGRPRVDASPPDDHGEGGGGERCYTTMASMMTSHGPPELEAPPVSA